jgi:PAS domain S-box-containing protein
MKSSNTLSTPPSADLGPPRPSRPALRRLASALARRNAPGFGRAIGAHILPIAVAATWLALVATAFLVQPGLAGFAIVVLFTLALAATHLLSPSARSHDTRTAGDERLASLDDRLERRIEQIQDLEWTLSENEARYRDLLDTQEDVISRRDKDGRLTFVNRAFCRVFGISTKGALGTLYRPVSLERSASPALAGSEHPRRHRFEERIATSHGARWFAFEEHSVEAGDGTCEVQSVGRDITDERQVEAELAHARDQAEAANRAKSRFLASMSHEIRTPMNGILGMAGLLLDTGQTPEQQSYTRAIDQSARTLLALIDEILDFSKIEAGKLALQADPFVLETCVQGAVELLATRAHEKGLEIAWSLEPGVPRQVVGDEPRLRQILLNLVGNAVKFTERGGVLVKVSAEPCGDRPAHRVRIAVKDTGIGLSHQSIKTVFAEFEQADSQVHRRLGGTGLGLAISKRLARAMNGDVTVESSLGRGATFTVDIEFADAPIRSVHAGDAGVADRRVSRVLIASDRLIERRVLAQTLRAMGIEVDETADLDTATLVSNAAASGRPIQALIVDAHAEAADAGRLLAEVRARAGAGTPRGFVLLNATGRAMLKEFRNHGFDGYLVRPVRPQSLLTQLNRGPVAEPGTDQVSTAAGTVVGAGRIGGATPPRVLVAEDNAINALLVMSMLEKAGCHAVRVANGREAVDAMSRTLEPGGQSFDIILMDVHMPELDGLAATQAIRQLFESAAQAGRHPPIVALTANAFAEDRKRCLEAGMDDYLSKPFERGDLERLLDHWLGPPGRGDNAKSDRGAAA